MFQLEPIFPLRDCGHTVHISYGTGGIPQRSGDKQFDEKLTNNHK